MKLTPVADTAIEALYSSYLSPSMKGAYYQIVEFWV